MSRLEQAKEQIEIIPETGMNLVELVPEEGKFASKQQKQKEDFIELAGWVHYCLSATPGIAAGTSSRFCGEYYVEPRRRKR